MSRDQHDDGVWPRLMRAAREASRASGRGQTPPARLSIISMMLVLVGLCTLKIR